MSDVVQQIRFFRNRIPGFACKPDCHDCCGPVTATSTEVQRLPPKSAAEHAAALEHLDCVYLGPQGCTVYAERPLICRLFGTTPSLPCPHGLGPLQPTDPAVETALHQFQRQHRQVLL
ncbi:YkgJ family cysteine cluster protein [Amantichitinum ursilacus]|uniref:Flagellin N-methylase n=1 Tax=Amantichitinum ursilacus TaxID=857265 RepID=A0A0N0XMF4_9NEIS|nr:YkgJ family cysteine cluster protein [Amantichitinum ursilacus]KPC54657.1 Flagellin N-methylase [Amantichitinum ursilacus]